MVLALLVDDNEDLLEVLGLVFARAGIESVKARSLDEVQALRPRLRDVTIALLDVNLGLDEPSGVDVARWLHGQGFEPFVVFVTGHAADHPLVRQATRSDSQVLSKPVESKVLLRLAREHA